MNYKILLLFNADSSILVQISVTQTFMPCTYVFWWEIQIPWLVELSEFKKRGNKMKKRTIIGPRKNQKLCLGLELTNTLFVL